MRLTAAVSELLGPSQIRELAEEHRQLLAAVRRLPQRQQEVLVLRYWSELSEAQIADALGISRGAVKSTASRAHGQAARDDGGARMNVTELEDRLRQAYAAQAETVTADRSDRALARPRPPTRRPAGCRCWPATARPYWQTHWLGPALAAGAVAAAVIATLLVVRRPDSSPTPGIGRPATSGSTSLPTPSASPSGSAASSPPAAPSALRRGEQAGRADVPWSTVGRGWTLTTWWPDSGSDQLVYLVNPAGGRYLLASTARDLQLVLWSPDARRALFVRSGLPSRELNLATGVFTDVAAAVGASGLIGYTRPLGTALLVVGSGGAVRNIDLHTNATRTYPRTGTQVGALNGAAPLYTPDGLRLLFGAGHGLAVVSNSGSLLSESVPPDNATDCRAERWWSPGLAVVSCTSGGVPEVMLVHIGDEAKPALSWQPLAAGYDEAWPTTGAAGVLSRADSCGRRTVATLGSDGTIRPARLLAPAGVNGTPALLAVDGTRLTVVTGVGQVSCAGGRDRSLMMHDLTTGADTVLLGPGLNGGRVAVALGFAADS